MMRSAPAAGSMSAPRCSRRSPGSGARARISSSATLHRRWCSGCARERTGRAGGDGGVSRRLPAASGPAPTHLDHAPGRALSARVPCAARQGQLRGAHSHARPRRGSDASAPAALRARCRHPLQRHLTPLQGMGVDLAFEPGPVVREPIRTDAQIDALPALVPQRDVPFVLETIRLVRANVPRAAPLIGFAGAPFTLLCYLVCGRPSKEFAAARTFLYAQPHAAQRLLERLADAMAEYLAAQARAGAQALMLFESWAGLLGVREFTQFALPAVRRTAAALRRAGVPLIYYVTQGSALMPAVA